MKLSLVSIMQDEAALVEQWAAHAKRLQADEVVVVDGGSTDETVSLLQTSGIRVISNPFQGDFAAQRNFALEQVSGDWILELDADEALSEPLRGGLRDICEGATVDNVAVIGIPRITFHDGELASGAGTHGLDYQYRLHRRGLHWEGRVHEELKGKPRVELDLDEGHFIVHRKALARHTARNVYYKTLLPKAVEGTPVKIVTMCRQGLVRSVALADVLKLHFRPVCVVPIGHAGNSTATKDMLFRWADRIVVMEDHYRKYVPDTFASKLLVCDVGPDVNNPQGSKTRHLIDKVWNWTRQNQELLGIEEHGERL